MKNGVKNKILFEHILNTLCNESSENRKIIWTTL